SKSSHTQGFHLPTDPYFDHPPVKFNCLTRLGILADKYFGLALIVIADEITYAAVPYIITLCTQILMDVYGFHSLLRLTPCKLTFILLETLKNLLSYLSCHLKGTPAGSIIGRWCDNPARIVVL